MTVYRSDWTSYAQSAPIASWSHYHFHPVPADSLHHSPTRFWVRCEPFPIRIEAPVGSKVVTSEMSGRQRLVVPSHPFERWDAETVVWLARQGKRGLRCS